MGSRGNEFSADEQRTLMTLWTIARSPLIMGEGRYLAVFQRHRCRQGHRHPPAGNWRCSRPRDPRPVDRKGSPNRPRKDFCRPPRAGCMARALAGLSHAKGADRVPGTVQGTAPGDEMPDGNDSSLASPRAASKPGPLLPQGSTQSYAGMITALERPGYRSFGGFRSSAR
jgi:hypothetical protein